MQVITKIVDQWVPWVSWERGRWFRRLMVLLLLGMTLGFGWFASTSDRVSLIYSSIIIAVVLVVGLLFDSFATFWHFFGFSKENIIYFITKVDSQFGAVVNKLKEDMRNAPESELESIVKHGTEGIMSDYENRQPVRSILALLLARNITNLLITVVTFSAISGNLIILHKCWGLKDSPYRHECRPSGTRYGHLLLHGFYYHSVIFQSLGDGDHIPVTVPAQIVSTSEAYIAMSYLALLIGGSISAALYAEGRLTEHVVRRVLLRSLLPIWTRRVPIRQAGDPRLSGI